MLKYSLEIVDLLLERDVKMIVVACNSASAAALDHLQEQLSIPVVGVIEPGVRAAVDDHGERQYRRDRDGRHDRVGRLPARGGRRCGPTSSSRAPRVRDSSSSSKSGDVDSDQVHVLAERLLAPIKRANVDTLVLGCTHYPLLARTIADVMGPDVVLVSSADETAFAVHAQLAEDRARPRATSRRVNFLTSGDVQVFRHLGARFLGPEVEHVEAWTWS